MIFTGDVDVPPFVLPPHESAFLVYRCKEIKQMLYNDRGHNEKGHVFLSFDDKMQSHFKNWVEVNITQITFTNNELSLHLIVNSIWEKTKNYVEGVLNETQNTEGLAFQKLALVKADQKTADMIKKGYEGKTFTTGQVLVLLDTAQKEGWL